MNQRFLFILTAILLLPIRFESVFSQEELNHGEGTYITPSYADLVPRQETEKSRNSQQLRVYSRASGDTESAESIEELGMKLKKQLLEHRDVILLSFYTNTNYNSADFMMDAYDIAVAHTGVPYEGDYLRFNIIYLEYKYTQYYAYTETKFLYRYDVQYTITYTQTKAQEDEISSKINSVIASLNPDGTSEAAKIRAVYDYVIDHVDYYDDISPYSHSTHAALFSNYAVCQGYSTLTYRLLLRYGIDNRIAASSTHSWNIVKVGTTYYHLDTTWGDTYKNADYFFLRSSKGIRARDSKGEHTLTTDCAARLSGYNISEQDDWDPSITPTLAPVITPTATVEIIYIPGDMTGDGKLNALDLVRLKRYLGGEDVQLAASGDVTNDGKINALDLVRLKRYLGGENVVIY